MGLVGDIRFQPKDERQAAIYIALIALVSWASKRAINKRQAQDGGNE